MKNRFALALTLAAATAAATAACASSAPPATAPVMAVVRPQAVPLASSVATPVPIVRARPNPGAGRADPFVALYGPPSESANNSMIKSMKNRVKVSSFPNIPTLPGFEGGAAADQGPWAGVRLSGIMRNGNYIVAIIEAGGKSYIAHPGDLIGARYRVQAIGPSSVRLSSSDGTRTFSLGG
jgi:hypothetical protein